MRAVLVYESMFGHTRQVAEQVAEGLRSGGHDVRVLQVAHAGAAELTGVDLVVVGAPTHVHSLPSWRTRLAAVSAPDRYGGGAQPEPGAEGSGLREWFVTTSGGGGVAAAFDTRASGPALLTGRASRIIAKRLAERGFVMVGDAPSFVVGAGAALAEGELSRAKEWGRSLAALVPSAQGERRPAQAAE